MYAPKTPPGRGWYFFLCCGEALGCKCLCQFFVLLAAECAVPVNDVAADGESVCGGFLVYQARYDGLAERFDRTKARLDEVGSAITEKQAKREQIERFLVELGRQDGVATEFDEKLWYSLVDFVTVFNKEDVRFTFKDGTEIKV